MPPIHEILDACRYAVLPAAAAAIAAFAVVAKFGPARIAFTAAAIALAAGFLAGNHFRGALEYRLDPERSLNAGDLGRALVATFTPLSEETDDESEEERVPPPLSFYWLPWTTGLALLAGIATQRLHFAAAWPIRLVAIAMVAALAVPSYLREESPWVAPLFAAVVLGEWLILGRLVRESTLDRLRCGPAAAGSLVFFGASIVLLHAHSARLADTAVILSAALGAIAAVAWLLRADASAVAPGVAVALPSLLLSGHQDTFSEVPWAAFALTAVAPLFLAPLLSPKVRALAWRKWLPMMFALAFGPVVFAAVLTMRAESLSFG